MRRGWRLNDNKRRGGPVPGPTHVIFSLDEHMIALAASAVTYVIRAIEPKMPLSAPELLLGLVNLGGRIIPLINIRKQFGLPERDMRISDRIIITESAGYPAAFVVDAIVGVEALQVRRASVLYPQMQAYMAGIANHAGQTVLIHNIDTLIPEQTANQVHQFLEAAS